MIRSPSLNIIIKALDKVSSKIARDFGEIENLQSNSFAALKFANSCYKAVKERLVKDLTAINPNYNIRFLDGETIINDKDSKFCYVIVPIDGLFNFSRGITNFSNVIALEEGSADKKEITAIAISNVAHNEVYIASKGNGAFLNNRRIRISSHKPIGNILCGLTNQKLFSKNLVNDKNIKLQLSNCPSLDVAYHGSGKLDLVLFDKNDQEILKITSILIKEAGGSITQNGDILLVGNNKLIS